MRVYSIATIVVLATGMALISAQSPPCPAGHCCFDVVTTRDVPEHRCPVVLSPVQLCRVNPCSSNRYCRVSNGRVQCCREESRRLSTAFGSTGNRVSCRRTCVVPFGPAPSPPCPSCPSEVPKPTQQRPMPPPRPVAPTLKTTRPPPPPRGSYPCPSNIENGSYRLVGGVLVLYNCNSGFRLVGSNTAFCSGGTTTLKPPSCEGGPVVACCFDYVTSSGNKCPVELTQAQVCSRDPCRDDEYCQVSNRRTRCCKQEFFRLSTAFGQESSGCRQTCVVRSTTLSSPPFSCPPRQTKKTTPPTPEQTEEPTSPTPCLVLPAPSNGVVTIVNDDKDQSDSTATYKCNSGYRLQPPNSPERKCVNGRWLGDAPQCIPDCPTFPTCPSQVTPCRFYYTTSRSVPGHRCPVVLLPQQLCRVNPCPSNRYCRLSNGRAQCCREESRRLSTAFGSTGNRVSCRRTCVVSFGSAPSPRNPSCPSQVQLATQQRQCPPRCSCPTLPAPCNGIVTTVNDNPCVCSLMATYSCNSGYRLQPPNSSERKCVNGEWLGDAPQCIPDCPNCRPSQVTPPPPRLTEEPTSRITEEPTSPHCPDLDDPSNGAVSVSEDRTTATYSCNFGYYLRPNKAVRLCTDGEWSGQAPKCAPRKECHTFESCKKVCVKGKALCERNPCTEEDQYCRVKRGKSQCCKRSVRETDNKCVTKCRSAPP